MPFSEFVLKYGPWSATKIDVATQCGHRFKLKYIDRQKEPVQTERAEGRIGAAAHRTQELVLKGVEIKKALKMGAVDNSLTNKEIEELKLYQGTILEFAKKSESFQQKNPTRHVFIEHKFALSPSLTESTYYGKGALFRGVWDYALALESGDLVIFDHKSGTPSEDTSKYKNQLSIYALAGRILLPYIRGVRWAVHWLKNGSVVWGDYVTRQQIDGPITNWFVEEYIGKSLSNIGEAATPGWYCGYCGYASGCAAYKERNS